MNKTLSIGNFTELSENEVMETEGGVCLCTGGYVINDPKAALGNIAAGAIGGIPGGPVGIAYGVAGGIVASVINGSISYERLPTTDRTRSSSPLAMLLGLDPIIL